MEAFVSVLIAGLAGSQLVEVIHHGSLFRPLQNWAADTASPEARVLPVPFVRFFARLFNCPFCMAHWSCAAMVLLIMLSFITVWIHFVVWVFAATRIANLSNDLFYDRIRSPKNEEVIEDILAEEDDASDPEAGDES